MGGPKKFLNPDPSKSGGGPKKFLNPDPSKSGGGPKKFLDPDPSKSGRGPATLVQSTNTLCNKDMKNISSKRNAESEVVENSKMIPNLVVKVMQP